MGEGKDFTFTNTLSVEPHQDDLTVIGGLSHPRSRHCLVTLLETLDDGGDVE